MKDAMIELLARLVPLVQLEKDTTDTESSVVCVPNSHGLHSLEQYQPAPNRIKAKPALASCESFCEYVNRFKNEETTVYLDMHKGMFRAALDHYGTEPSWVDHTASFEPLTSLQWQAWTRIHKQAHPQVNFAEFIEENLDDIVEPPANEVLKAALQFQSKENVTLDTAQNLDSGAVKFNFVKDSISSTVTFPHRIKVLIPVFENEPPKELEARIRYRVSTEGALSFTFSFVRNPQMVHRKALEDIADNINKNVADAKIYQGVR